MSESSSQRVFRFAPSPNGYLHLGHAYSALMNEKLARQAGGKLLLRIEDIDVGRCRPEYEAAIYDDLDWLGLRFDGEPRRQSDHFSDYALAVERLAEKGLVYPCVCTRAEIARAATERFEWPRDPDGAPVYPGTCKRLRDDEPALRERGAGRYAAQRLDMNEALAEAGARIGWREYGETGAARDVSGEPNIWGDVVLARKDVPASYHIAVVVDDALQGVTDVVRGTDLLAATSLHRLLQILLGLPAPDYHHHDLVRDGDGAKMSKSALSKPLRSLRAEGATPEDIRRRLGFGVAS
jgi:glutamyl-Q tRNA(Asp) synthetase